MPRLAQLLFPAMLSAAVTMCCPGAHIFFPPQLLRAAQPSVGLPERQSEGANLGEEIGQESRNLRQEGTSICPQCTNKETEVHRHANVAQLPPEIRTRENRVPKEIGCVGALTVLGRAVKREVRGLWGRGVQETG